MRDLEESSLARFTIPDVLTPAQFFDGVRKQHPEMHGMKRLQLAVLEDALRCLQRYTESRNPIHRRMFAEVEFWILDKAHGPFAFEAVCEILEIQPDHLRNGIRQWRMQLSNGLDSRRLQRRSMRRSEPKGSLLHRRSNHSGPPRGDAWTAGLLDR